MVSLSAWIRHPRRWVFVVSPILGFFLVYHLLQTRPDAFVDSLPIAGEQEEEAVSSFSPAPDSDNSSTPAITTEATSCNYIHGMEDILVVMKTGVTEVREKVPVHINTTLKCVPHYVIFSDYEEEIAGVRTYDVLRSVSNETKQANLDFGIYNRLHDQGREGLLAADWRDEANGPFGKPGNPGWKLDKWKFVPMMNEALQVRPNAKWYVFIEADSYMVWPNLVAWLSRLDHKKPYYLGAPMQIGNILFAYGGSGIILSNPAMQMVSKHRAGQSTELEKFTADNWAGDCVLGKVLHDAGVRLLWSWPMLQTARVWELDHFAEGYGRKPWCYPAISYHHMDTQDIEVMWHFDQEWFGDVSDDSLVYLFTGLTSGYNVGKKFVIIARRRFQKADPQRNVQ